MVGTSLAIGVANGAETAYFRRFCDLSSTKTMLRLKRGGRRLVAKNMSDAANVALGAIVFGPLLGGHALSWLRTMAGAAVWAALLAFAVWCHEE